MSALAKPIAYLKDVGGYYTPAELADRVNMPVADVKSAIAAASKVGIVEGRRHRGKLQVRYCG